MLQTNDRPRRHLGLDVYVLVVPAFAAMIALPGFFAMGITDLAVRIAVTALSAALLVLYVGGGVGIFLRQEWGLAVASVAHRFAIGGALAALPIVTAIRLLGLLSATYPANGLVTLAIMWGGVLARILIDAAAYNYLRSVRHVFAPEPMPPLREGLPGLFALPARMLERAALFAEADQGENAISDDDAGEVFPVEERRERWKVQILPEGFDLPALPQEKNWWVPYVILAFVMLLGGYMRFAGLQWDDYTHLHPDERFLTDVTSNLGDPGIMNYFNTDVSQANPHNVAGGRFGLYVYGTLPLFIVRTVSYWAALITGDLGWMQYGQLHLVGRAVSAVADMITILVLFLAARKLYDKWIGLVAAALYAFAVLPIQLSHFYTMDAFTVLPVVLTFWAAIDVMKRNRWRDYVLFGLFWGASMASRINVAPIGGLVGLAAIGWLKPYYDLHADPDERWAAIWRAARGLILTAIVAFVAFRIFQPYAFSGPSIFGIIPNPKWVDNIRSVQLQVSGQVDMPPGHQWAGRIPYIFPLKNMVLWGMGLPMGLMAWAGFVWAGWRLLMGREGWRKHLLPVVWILVYFGWQGGQWVMSMRYFVTLYPFLALLAAWALMSLIRRAGVVNWQRAAAFGLAGIVIGATFVYGLAFTSVFTEPLTRVAASRWVLDNLPGDFTLEVVPTEETPPLAELQGEEWELNSAACEIGQPVTVNIAMHNDPAAGDVEGEPSRDPMLQASRYYDVSADPEIDGQRKTTFTAPCTGTISAVTVTHLGDPEFDPDEETFAVELLSAEGSVLASASVTGDFGDAENPLGRSYTLTFDAQVEVAANTLYRLAAWSEEGGPIITAGTTIATEGPWDDPIPWKIGAIDGFGQGYYQGLEMHMALDDVDLKRENMLAVLNNTEYITMSSNRFYDSLTRNPARFPMSTRYYDALFTGELGFERLKTFESFATLGPLEIRDQWIYPDSWFEAEEAFHVYDHPIVLIFKKTADYDAEKVARILYGVDLDQAIWRKPVEIGAWSTGMMLPPDMWETQRAGGTWTEIFDGAALNQNQVLAVVVWWLAAILIGWLAWPLLFAAFPGLADRGYNVAKIAGMLIIATIPWWLANLQFDLWNRGGVLLAMAILAVASGVAAWWRRTEMVAYLRANWRKIIVWEGVALILYAAFLLVKLSNPDIWHNSYGGERPMNMAYFNAVLRSTVFPPYDPWFAGGKLNYYYYGYVILGGPVKLLGIEPALVYNLALPLFFSLVGTGAFGIAYNLVEGLRERLKTGRWAAFRPNPWLAGGLAIFLTLIMGNLHTIVTIIEGLARSGGWTPGMSPTPTVGQIIDGFGALLGGRPLMIASNWWFWNPTRIIADCCGGAITEMPYFTFIYGDLHAHMIAMPLQLVTLAVSLGLVQSAKPGRHWAWRLLGAALLALNVGALFPTNSWDFPSHLAIGALAITFAAWLRSRRPDADGEGDEIDPAFTLPSGEAEAGLALLYGIILWPLVKFARSLRLHWREIAAWGAEVVFFVAASFGFFYPYWRTFITGYGSISVWEGPYTPIPHFLDMHGPFLFIMITYFIHETYRLLRTTRIGAFRRWGWWPFLLLAAGSLGLLAAWVLALTGPITILLSGTMTVWGVLLFFWPTYERERRAVIFILTVAFAILAFVEVIVLANDIARQNTVFKFYMEVWLFMGSAGGAVLAWLLARADSWRASVRVPWKVGLAILLGIAAMFPIMATQGKQVAARFSQEVPLTLDGNAYMKYAVHGESELYFPLEHDYWAIQWLQQNVEGTPVVLEAQTRVLYGWQSRIAVNTGLPTVMGWDHHQRQQRSVEPWGERIWARVAEVQDIYNTANIPETVDFLRKYEVGYVIVGALEQAYYDPAGLEKFEGMVELGYLEPVFTSEVIPAYPEARPTTIYRVLALPPVPVPAVIEQDFVG